MFYHHHMVHTDMGTRWRLKEVCEARGITGYRLAKTTQGRLSKTQIYSLLNTERPGTVYLDTLDTLIDALAELGHEISYNDLFVYERGLFDSTSGGGAA